MPAQLKDNPKEDVLFNLVDGLDDITTQCMRCRDIRIKEYKSYVFNTATRTKIMIFCSKHLDAALCIMASFQDATRREPSLILNNVTPASAHASPIYIYNFPLIIDGKKTKILLATNVDVHAVTRGGKAVVYPLKEAAPTPAGDLQKAPEAGNPRVALYTADLFRRIDASQLSGSDRLVLLRSGLDQMDIANRALEVAYENLKRVLPGLNSDKINKNVQGRAMRLHGSAHAITKIEKINDVMREEAAAKAQQREDERGECEKEADIADEEVMPFVRDHLKDMLQAAQVDTMRGWLNSL